MDRLRICIDTSVLGGCFDEEFALWSNGLMRDFLAGLFIPVLSDVAAAEVREVPEAVQEVHREMLRLAGEVLPVTAEAVDLVEAVSGEVCVGSANAVSGRSDNARSVTPRRAAPH